MPNNNLESHGMLISNMYGYFKCLCLKTKLKTKPVFCIEKYQEDFVVSKKQKQTLHQIIIQIFVTLILPIE